MSLTTSAQETQKRIQHLRVYARGHITIVLAGGGTIMTLATADGLVGDPSTPAGRMSASLAAIHSHALGDREGFVLPALAREANRCEDEIAHWRKANQSAKVRDLTRNAITRLRDTRLLLAALSHPDHATRTVALHLATTRAVRTPAAQATATQAALAAAHHDHAA